MRARERQGELEYNILWNKRTEGRRDSERESERKRVFEKDNSYYYTRKIHVSQNTRHIVERSGNVGATKTRAQGHRRTGTAAEHTHTHTLVVGLLPTHPAVVSRVREPAGSPARLATRSDETNASMAVVYGQANR